MQCPYCRCIIDDDSVFCASCGKRVDSASNQMSSGSNNPYYVNPSTQPTNRYPVQPNGALFSKEDYLAQSPEFLNEKKQLSRTGNILLAIGAVIMLIGGIGSVALSIFGNFLVGMGALIISEIAGIVLAIIGNSSAKRNIANLEEKYYQDYVNSFRR